MCTVSVLLVSVMVCGFELYLTMHIIYNVELDFLLASLAALQLNMLFSTLPHHQGHKNYNSTA